MSRGEAPDWTRIDGPLFGVCTHGRHDACCAERGRPVAAALTASHPAETWEISHMGGDRLAANMVVLPEGLYYGRMDPGTAPQVASLHEEGRVDLARLRGRSPYPMHVQYAEIALRRHLEEDRLDAVRLVPATRLDLRLPAPGRRVGGHRATHRAGPGPSSTCAVEG